MEAPSTLISSSITDPGERIEPMSLRNPTHPGHVLKEDVFPALNMPITEIASKLGISRAMLYGIMEGKNPISADTAQRLGKFLGNGPDLWMNMQVAYDLAQSGKALAAELKKIPTVKAA
jgi:addiction module HigA family antidote